MSSSILALPAKGEAAVSNGGRSRPSHSAGMWAATLVLGVGSVVPTLSETAVTRVPEGTGWWVPAHPQERQSTSVDLPSTAKRVVGLKELSGLTWDQLAALFGVTRRAVHHWAQGSNMTANHINRLDTLQTRFEQESFRTDDTARSWLFERDPQKGLSRYSTWVAEVGRSEIDVPTGTVAQQVEGARPAKYIAQKVAPLKHERPKGPSQ